MFVIQGYLITLVSSKKTDYFKALYVWFLITTLKERILKNH